MPRTLKSDRMLFLTTLLLVGLSVVMVYSASAVQAQDRYQTSTLFLYKQLLWAVIGVTVMLGVMRIDYQELRRPTLIWTLIGVTIVLLIAVFFVQPINKTQRWIPLGFASIQPSELAKLGVVLFTAALLERRMHRINDVAHAIVPIAAVTLGLAYLVISQPDYGTAVMLVLIVLSMMFVAGLNYRYLFGSLLVLLPPAMILVYTSAYRMKRIMTFLDPTADEFNTGFQISHSLMALGSGGILGKGLMAGVEKLYYIPEPHTDFIFAVIGEELGLVGTTLTLACFVIIGWRGLRTALLAPDRFGALLGVGITTMMVAQALVNMSVVTALAPTKGIPLPFVSNGGSSLLINLVAMGILINISQQALPETSARARGSHEPRADDRQDSQIDGAEARA
jgi:cell division protein FtsW